MERPGFSPSPGNMRMVGAIPVLSLLHVILVI